MRLLEHHIVEIYHTYQYEDEWTLQSDIKLIAVKMLINCNGEEYIDKKIFEKNQWERIQKQGYFMSRYKYN